MLSPPYWIFAENFPKAGGIGKSFLVLLGCPSGRYRELTNRRLSHDDAVGLRDMPTAHAFVGSCRRRAKVDDVVLSKFTASPKQKNVR